MYVDLGLDAYALSQRQQRRAVRWDSQSVINGHWLICGASGTGKTYTIRRCLEGMQSSARTPLRIHVFDVHGDLDMPGASTVRFSEASPHGFNPLIVNPDPHFGGVRRKVQSVIAALNRTSRALGPKQEAVLRAILMDLYAANGFYADRPDTWRIDAGRQQGSYGRKHPSLLDVIRFASSKLKQLYLGTDAKTVVALEDLNSHVRRMANAQRAANKATIRGDVEDADKKLSALETLRAKAVDSFTQHLESLISGRELDDVLKYDSKEVLKSVVDRIENLNGIGIFKPAVPPFDVQAPIWRYDISSLPPDEAKLFVWFRLEAIFAKAMERGVQPDVCEVIVLDEAHRYASGSAEEDVNPVDTIAREARKFGVGLMGVSQSVGHFSEDFLSNVACKVILGLDEMHWDAAIRKLKIPEKTLKFIRPRNTMAVQMKTPGDVRNSYFEVAIGNSAAAA